MRELVAAVSVGIVDGQVLLDLDYSEDSQAEVDSNVVMTASGGLVETQATAEKQPYTRAQLATMLDYAEQGIAELIAAQRRLLAVTSSRFLSSQRKAIPWLNQADAAETSKEFCMSLTKPTPGKLAGLKAVSDARGVIAAAAMDQRGSLQKSHRLKARGGRIATDAALWTCSRSRVTECAHAATPPPSLLDPEFGLPASHEAQRRRAATGLREDRLRRRYGRPPARPARPSGAVRRSEGSGRGLHQDPALLHAIRHRPTINDLKHAWVERIGDECNLPRHPVLSLSSVGYDVAEAAVTRSRWPMPS